MQRESVFISLEVTMPASVTVLHVEDDSNDALLFKNACDKAGVVFGVQSVNDGDEAIAYLTGEKGFSDRTKCPMPQLILLDLKMPRLSGFDLLEWIRKQESFSKLPVIVFSSSNQESDVTKAYNLGANSYLLKPGSFDDMVQLAKSLDGYWVTLNQSSRQ